MKTIRVIFVLVALLALASVSASAQTVRIVEKPTGLVSGKLQVPIVATEPVASLALLINGVEHSAAAGRQMTSEVNVGFFIRRLRLRAVGYDVDGNIVAEDDMVVNDPRPPFRVNLQAPAQWPEAGPVELHANLLRPAEVLVSDVDFYVGEELVASDASQPYSATIDAMRFPGAVYARVVARANGEQEANDVAFFGDRAHAETDVTVQQIPLSIASGATPLKVEHVTLLDNGMPRQVEALAGAADQPLHVILLIDYSESMLEELPVVKAAAREFARTLLRPQDRLAVVGFNQRTFWMTGYTNDWNKVAQVVDKVQPIGETHLYDSVIEMLYELQKTPGRHALVVLTDGVDQGSRFKLDHLVHYARYAGVPVYPVVKNRSLSRWMKLGIGRVQARRLANIAEDTGATYFIIQSERELAKVYGRIAHELRQQYRLVFHSESGVPDGWRTLKVESSGGHNLRVPRGYFP